MSKINKIYNILINSLLPIVGNTALFSSFQGQYNDNPRYISEELHKRCPRIRIIWVISEKSKEELPLYVTTVFPGSREYYKYVSRAQIVVDNHLGMRAGEVTPSNHLKRIAYAFYCRKRKHQLCISTWHGTALKRIGKMNIENKYATCTDFLVFGNRLIQKQIRDSYGITIPSVLYGSPRNDILFCKSREFIEKTKKKLGIPENYKVAIYAPTFRAKEKDYGAEVLGQLNREGVLSALSDALGGKWCLVVRVHHLLLKYLMDTKRKTGLSDCIDGNIGDDMAEYMVCSDVLITDYSSNMFDYLVTGRPCFLFSPDLEYYRDTERGFLVDYDGLPFPKATDREELSGIIRDFDPVKYQKDTNKYQIEIGNHESGNASARIVDDIEYFIQYGKKTLMKRLT